MQYTPKSVGLMEAMEWRFSACRLIPQTGLFKIRRNRYYLDTVKQTFVYNDISIYFLGVICHIARHLLGGGQIFFLFLVNDL